MESCKTCVRWKFGPHGGPCVTKAKFWCKGYIMDAGFIADDIAELLDKLDDSEVIDVVSQYLRQRNLKL